MNEAIYSAALHTQYTTFMPIILVICVYNTLSTQYTQRDQNNNLHAPRLRMKIEREMKKRARALTLVYKST